MIDDRHSFRGFKDTMLRFDQENTQWRMDLYSTEEAYATTNAEDYPFGIHEWEIVGDPCYNKGNATVVSLNINACNESEFNCNDGYCISIDQRCDGKVQCPDKTGEYLLEHVTRTLWG